MLLEKIQLESDEKILIQTRRHWFIIVSRIAALVIVALVPLPVLFALNHVVTTNENLALEVVSYTAEIVFFYSVWLMFLWFAIFNVWTNYYLDVLTITDRRAILINQKGFFRRQVTSFRLERLQDMNIAINGIIATLLDYGDLKVETAGHSEEEFYVASVPSPRELKGLILQATDTRMKVIPGHDGVA